MPEQPGFVERHWKKAAAVAAVASLALTGCSRMPGNAGPGATPGVTHSASPNPGAETAPADMAESDDPQLQVLADYETALHREFKHEMYFTDMPRTVEEAESQADDMARTLKEYGKYGLRPLIIMEPTNNDGGNLPLEKLHSPGYGHVLGALFKGLKDRGVTDQEMGTLFPVPEADLPNWGKAPHSTSPALFGKNFAAVGHAFRKVFPDGDLGVLLDSTAYPTGDTGYEHGDTAAISLLPFIEALKHPKAPKVQVLMFQGFPFVDGSTPDQWLNSGVATDLAKNLGAHTIWFNTGTARFINGHKVSADTRASLLHGELHQAKAARAAGYTVMVNVFAGEDQGPTILWNYPITHGRAANPLTAFEHAADAAGIGTALFADQTH